MNGTYDRPLIFDVAASTFVSSALSDAAAFGSVWRGTDAFEADGVSEVSSRERFTASSALRNVTRNLCFPDYRARVLPEMMEVPPGTS